jgi:hypothetical protein
MKNTVRLPKGDLYRVIQKRDRFRRIVYTSYIQREKECTVCCSGTHSFKVIEHYLDTVRSVQEEVMSGHGISADLLTYWKAYRARMMSQYLD